MNPDLEKLVRLQNAEIELKRVETELAEVPRALDELEARLASDRSRLDAAREALESCQKGRRQHEASLQDLESKRSKYKGQLMEVKTNKEYTAMLHEIEAVEREIRAREDQVLAEMERAETLAAALKQEEAAYEVVAERFADERAMLQARSAELEQQARQLSRGRDEIAAGVPEEALGLFQRVARLRGVAVTEARDGMCQLCHMKLRPQMYVELKRNDSIIQCEACSRILYYETPAAGVSPEP